ncbi:MAG: cysteine desulfurase family protein [Cytophagales bacterium]
MSISQQRIFFDNASTTPTDPLVLEAMLPYLTGFHGNPSSIHSHGRESRSAIEKARKSIANLLNTSPSQLFFTSGGTESDNTAIMGTVRMYNIKHAISTAIEHHAVLHTLQYLEKLGEIELHFLTLDAEGQIDLEELKMLLVRYPNSLVSLMQGNNEIGNLLDIEAVGDICQAHKAFFHSDTVQTLGHYKHDLKALKVDFMVGAAHKFHGPKGIGLLYIGEGKQISPFVHGGSQERNMRGGTENIAAIMGMAKALELAYERMEIDKNHIVGIKKYLKEKLLASIPQITFNGLSADLDKSLYTVLSVLFPKTEIAEMLLFNLDINKISVSGGSACTSGTNIGSHVLNALYGPDDERPAVRFSFSKYNTIEEVDIVVDKIKRLFEK